MKARIAEPPSLGAVELILPRFTDTLWCRRFAQGGKSMPKRWLVRIVYVLLAALVLANSGCLGLVIGGAVGGAAAGYAIYQRGEWYRDYPATLDDAGLAVKTALGELQLPLVNEKRDDDAIIIDSRTGDDAKIHIHLSLVPSRIPA